MILYNAVDEFLLAKEAGMRASSTLEWYAKYLNPFRRQYGTVDIERFTMRQVATWLIQQPGAPQQKHNRDRAIRTFFSWCEPTYGIKSPMNAIPLPKLPEPDPKAIEVDTLNRLIAACKTPRDAAIILTMADCGIRAGGIVSLRIDDLDFACRVMRVTEKGSRSRAVPFSLTTEQALIAWCKRRHDCDWLFCSYTGQQLHYAGLRQIMRRLAERAQIPNDERHNLHSLRHFAAQEYLRQGGSLPSLARILGHKTIDTTARYYAIYSGSELAELHDEHSPLKSLAKKEYI